MAPREAWSRRQTTFSDENGRIPACRQAGSAERFCRSKNINSNGFLYHIVAFPAYS